MKADSSAEQTIQIPLLLASAVSAQAAAYVVTASIGDAGFSVLIHLALLAGYAVAYWNLRHAAPVSLITTGILVISLGGFVAVHSGVGFAGIMFPNAAGADPNLTLANLLVWFLVGFSFSQAHRRQMVFISAAGVALFGLIGVINLEVGYLIAFAIFLFTTILAWGYDGLMLRTARQTETHWQRVVAAQAVSAAPVLAATALAGFLVATALYTFVPNPFMSNLAFHPLLNWAGYLSQGNFSRLNQLAVGTGPARLGDEVLFRVKADAPALWRTSAYDHYDGHTWSRAQGNDWPIATGPEPDTYTQPAPEGPQRKYCQQEFTVERATTGLILAAQKPVRIVLIPSFLSEGRTDVRADPYGCLSFSSVRTQGTKYQVLSALTDADPGLLRRARGRAAVWMTPYYVENIPLAVDTGLRPLVTELCSNLTNNYDKAMAIQTYLEEHCFYTDAEPVTPADEDAVTYFVLDTRRGACDVFASAMAMMLRLTNVPCRVATGFISGPADPDAPGWNVIRSKDAHAWVEVYFPGYDWIPFNPTPPRQLEQVSLLTLLKEGQFWYAVGQMARRVGVAALALMGLLLFLSAVADPRLVRARWAQFRVGRDPWERAARECTRATARAVVCAGLPAVKGETPLEMLGRVQESPPNILPQALARLRALTAEYYQARFSSAVAPPGTPKRLARELRQVRKRLRCRKR